MSKNETVLLTKKETAEVLRVTQRTLDRYRLSGILTPIYLGRTVRYRRDDVQALIDGQASA